jgi:peptidoglycan/LPS O-acetylase OafA/YrhL
MGPAVLSHGQYPTLGPVSAVYHAVNFVFSFAFAVILSADMYQLIELPGRRAIRAAGRPPPRNQCHSNR